MNERGDREMSNLKDLQRLIKDHEGLVFSTDTLKLDDLLADAHRLMTFYNLSPTIRGDIEELFETEDNLFHRRLPGGSETADLASWIWGEDVCIYFDTISPPGYYYGSLEGDGACFGWWRIDDID